MKNIIDEINSVASTFMYLEFAVVSYKAENLIVAGSQDFLYYQNFEIEFENVFSIIGNLRWKANTKKAVLTICGLIEAHELNRKYRVEQGNTIFKFVDEDNIDIFFIARNIKFRNEVVKFDKSVIN